MVVLLFVSVLGFVLMVMFHWIFYEVMVLFGFGFFMRVIWCSWFRIFDEVMVLLIFDWVYCVDSMFLSLAPN